MNSATILISASHRHDDEDGMVIVGGAFEHLSHRNAQRSNLPHHQDRGKDHHEQEGYVCEILCQRKELGWFAFCRQVVSEFSHDDKGHLTIF